MLTIVNVSFKLKNISAVEFLHALSEMSADLLDNAPSPEAEFEIVSLDLDTISEALMAEVKATTDEIVKGVVEAAKAPEAPQPVRVAQPFKAGDKVRVEGDRLKGTGVVIAYWNKGEGGQYDKPRQSYPQIAIRPDGKGHLTYWHFNGDDLAEDKVILAK